ncbi:MAG: hypothetical protein KJ069_17520 [Anaerolineae bacterium]|nr:hypothetical protein [Anaerolineae bacterium]
MFTLLRRGLLRRLRPVSRPCCPTFANWGQTVHRITAVPTPSISPLPIVYLVYGRAKTRRCCLLNGRTPGTLVATVGKVRKIT